MRFGASARIKRAKVDTVKITKVNLFFLFKIFTVSL